MVPIVYRQLLVYDGWIGSRILLALCVCPPVYFLCGDAGGRGAGWADFQILRPEIRRDYPLNLSILLSGGEENNNDSPSNGE